MLFIPIEDGLVDELLLSDHPRINRGLTRNLNNRRRFRKSILEKSMVCSRCGFHALVSRQLHIHHKDRNPKNDKWSNFEILCANCHELEHAT